MKRRNFLKLSGAAAAATTLPHFAIGQSASATTLKFVPQADLASLDPVFNSSQIVSNHAFAVYDTLYAVNSKYDVKPQMAEGETVSADGRTVLIKLREGLKFHDGEPVRAQDCAPSLERWSKRDTMGQTVAKFVDSWGVQDDRTIKISLKRPFPLLTMALAKPGTIVPFMMPERLAKTDAAKEIKESIGSGPFKFVANEYVAGSRAVYTKFDNYVSRKETPDWATGAKIANFQRVEWHIIPDASTAAAALQNGEVDWWDFAQVDIVSLLRKNRDIKVGVSDPSGQMGFIRFNHTQPPFNDVRMRRAVLAAVNQEDYMRAVTGNDIKAFSTCKAMFPCATPYGTEIGQPAMNANIEEAKRLLKEAGYAGQKIVLLSPSDNPQIAPMGEVAFDMLKKMGMNVEFVSTDFGTVLQRRANRGPVEAGGWSLFMLRATGTSIINPLLAAPLRGQGANGYPGWYASEKMEQMAEEWVFAKDEAERVKIANNMQQEAFTSIPSVPLGLFFSNNAYRASLTGLIESPIPLFWGVKRA